MHQMKSDAAAIRTSTSCYDLSSNRATSEFDVTHRFINILHSIWQTHERVSSKSQVEWYRLCVVSIYNNLTVIKMSSSYDTLITLLTNCSCTSWVFYLRLVKTNGNWKYAEYFSKKKSFWDPVCDAETILSAKSFPHSSRIYVRK